MAEFRLVVSKLLKNCTILYDCRNCVFLAMKCIMECRCKKTSDPFMHHMDKVSSSIMNELLVCNKMSSCGYDEFHTHSATIWKMTNDYFAKVRVLKEDLEKKLQKQMEEKKPSQRQAMKSDMSKEPQ